ncbi:hypothetical protein JCM24511_03677 [Saitozyma sp. JCM 24511]|nr:hypothetical protein JCM24511_03677 [Saitozyma sp. JCM 24511]
MPKRKRDGPDACAALIKWLEAQQGYRSELVCRDVPGSGRGLFAARDMAAGETILEIPASAMINPLTLLSTSSIPTHLFPNSVSGTKLPRRGTAKAALANGDGDDCPGSGEHLTTTQLLTLQLALWRVDPAARGPWGVYVDTLPTEFRPWHPLSWLVTPDTPGSGAGSKSQAHPQWSMWHALADCLPRSTRSKLADVEQRFWRDVGIIRAAIVRVLDTARLGFVTSGRPDCCFSLGPPRGMLISQEAEDTMEYATLSTDVLLWAWLNVNTRTVSIPLGLPLPNEDNNHTLVPLLDMINHSSSPSQHIPRPIQIPSSSSATYHSYAKALLSRPAPNGVSHGPSSNGVPPGRRHGMGVGPGAGRAAALHLVPGRIGFRLIAPDRGLRADEEVTFEYGSHANATLFSEYGFIESPHVYATDSPGRGNSPGALSMGWVGLPHGEVDVGWVVDLLWSEHGSEEKLEVLEAISCWGRNTLHSQPSPPHPSYSLLMTLRLLHLPASSPKLQPIRDGLISYVSPENEAAAIKSLAERACSEGLAGLGKGQGDRGEERKDDGRKGKGPGSEDVVGEVDGGGEALIGVVSMIKGLWEEETALATAVAARVEKGDTDW